MLVGGKGPKAYSVMSSSAVVLANWCTVVLCVEKKS